MADAPNSGAVASPDKTPVMNAPASGTYGETAANDQLAAQLPTMPPSKAAPQSAPPVSPEPVSPQGGPGVGRPDTGGAAPPPGVPAAILQGGPTPGPTMAPLTNPLAGAATAAQGRIIVLQQLANSPDVSATTRTWAKQVLKVLL